MLGIDVARVADRLVGVGIEEDLPSQPKLGLGDRRQQRAPVLGDRGDGVGGIEDRRGEVDVGRELVHGRSRLDARPADQQRYVGRLLVEAVLAEDDAVLAVKEAVVGGEDHVGVCERTGRREGLDDVGHALVHRLQRGELAGVDGADLGQLLLRQKRRVSQRRRLVGDVDLVQAGGGRQGFVLECAQVPLGRLRIAAAAVLHLRRRVGCSAVRRVVGEPEKERLGGGGAPLDEVDRLGRVVSVE